MPIKRYFKGHGEEVMHSIRKAHPDYSEKRLKEEFYATANARKGKRKTNMGHSGDMPNMETRKAMRGGAHSCTVCGKKHDEHKGMYKGE